MMPTRHRHCATRATHSSTAESGRHQSVPHSYALEANPDHPTPNSITQSFESDPRHHPPPPEDVMQTIQGRTLISLRAAQDFLAKNADGLAGVADSGAKRRLDEILAELTAHATDQVAGTLQARSATRKQYALRRALIRYHIAPIVRIARVELAHTPELEPFRMPRGTPSVEKLAAVAHGIAAAAAPHAAPFISAGLPDDFVDQLTAAADALVDSVKERAVHRGSVRGATTGIRNSLVVGRMIVAVLDSFVYRAAAADEALLAGWNSVRHVERVAGRPARRTLDARAKRPGSETPALRLLPAEVSTHSTERALPPANDEIPLLQQSGALSPADAE
jgi:hypothetical protein